ncbi:serologically defined colon cancer antigen 3 homolog [Agrilus planipennis]|uniref:Endosome-associated-trafficking regulator 1 n=1 Tax=Agrilus planipennis TaxID=224129 RepID=A0A1W4XUG6_AGRPL|nr:serologically defined colon cancer antigen 3 homolog [Agrilus planipennis]
MAEGDENFPKNFRSKSPTNKNDSEKNDVSLDLDLALSCQKKVEHNQTVEETKTPGTSESSKREDNPFSFKHFLRSDSTNYQNQGARPKVYCDGRPISSISDVDLRNSGAKQTRIIPEYPSALPDFVQDHLVIEQCYLGKDSSKNSYSLDLNNLPGFNSSRSSININRLHCNSSQNFHPRINNSPTNFSVPLDLPGGPQAGFPLDLPISQDSQPSSSRSCPASTEAGVTKSLPDFLADGAVRTQVNHEESNNHSHDRELHHEIEFYQTQLAEQTRRANQLQRELDAVRSREHEYSENLSKALEKSERNLKRSNERALSAEGTIIKLRQEITALKNENNRLRKENESFRGEATSSGGATGGICSGITEIQSQRLAQELRNAASSAEHSLRQLLTGVDNLRIMAASLENMHRIEERRETFLDSDDDAAGPAL